MKKTKRAKAVRLWLRYCEKDGWFQVFLDAKCVPPMETTCGPEALRRILGPLPKDRPFCIEVRRVNARKR